MLFASVVIGQSKLLCFSDMIIRQPARLEYNHSIREEGMSTMHQ